MLNNRQEIDEKDKIIQKLKEQLYLARHTIISLAHNEKLRNVLSGYHSCNSTKEGYQWEHEIIDTITNHAQPIDSMKGYLYQGRAYCPLCGEGSNSYYEEGFSLPEGLKRHLEGFGNVAQCSVMKACFSLASEYWREKFKEKELKKREEEERVLENRRKTETLYQINPWAEPELIDDGLSWKGNRNEEGLLWAENRLIELGFSINLDDRTKSYTNEYEDTILFADPRSDQRIEFYVYKKPFPKRKNRSRVPKNYIGSFNFLDSWKHKLSEKFEKRRKQISEK